jgi:hypothetical protein
MLLSDHGLTVQLSGGFQDPELMLVNGDGIAVYPGYKISRMLTGTINEYGTGIFSASESVVWFEAFEPYRDNITIAVDFGNPFDTVFVELWRTEKRSDQVAAIMTEEINRRIQLVQKQLKMAPRDLTP